MTAAVAAMKKVKPLRTKVAQLRIGPEQDEARPSQATRSSSISNDAVCSCSTTPAYPRAATRGWDRKHTAARTFGRQLFAVLASPGSVREPPRVVVKFYAPGDVPR